MNETKTKVIRYRNLPLRGPLNMGLLWWIALEYFHATPVIWGIVGTIYGLYVVAWVRQIFTVDHINLD